MESSDLCGLTVEFEIEVSRTKLSGILFVSVVFSLLSLGVSSTKLSLTVSQDDDIVPDRLICLCKRKLNRINTFPD